MWRVPEGPCEKQNTIDKATFAMLDSGYSLGYWTKCLFYKHSTKKEWKDRLSPIFLVAIKNSFRFVQYPFFFARILRIPPRSALINLS